MVWSSEAPARVWGAEPVHPRASPPQAGALRTEVWARDRGSEIMPTCDVKINGRSKGKRAETPLKMEASLS